MLPTLYLVGGAVRDHLDGRTHAKDYDFAVEADSFQAMHDWFLQHGGTIYLSRPEYGTIRGSIPYAALPGDYGGAILPYLELDGDFTLCRGDGVYTDGRHPDRITPASLTDDLARRDFTINAMALDSQGTLLDPHLGSYDLRDRVIRCVGNPFERIEEDPLRILRAMRFAVTRNMRIDYTLAGAMARHASRLDTVSSERIVEELRRMFTHSTTNTLTVLVAFPGVIEYCFEHSSIWLLPTLRER